MNLGFRDFVDWEFLSVEFDPTLDSLRDEPRFRAQLKRIRADLAQQRIAAEARRKG